MHHICRWLVFVSIVSMTHAAYSDSLDLSMISQDARLSLVKETLDQSQQVLDLGKATVLNKFSGRVRLKVKHNLDEIKAIQKFLNIALSDLQANNGMWTQERQEEVADAILENARQASIVRNKLKSCTQDDFIVMDFKKLKAFTLALNNMIDPVISTLLPEETASL